ncbi:hypothetical protein M5K25_026630 [Dendrobium thyrsiflorum]|uniref:Uncharacterized protein n=1 Tax=Dendrobium thyrsiflorum TaxID=117978 RepID=A0ABD0TXS1_DENTH
MRSWVWSEQEEEVGLEELEAICRWEENRLRDKEEAEGLRFAGVGRGKKVASSGRLGQKRKNGSSHLASF